MTGQGSQWRAIAQLLGAEDVKVIHEIAGRMIWWSMRRYGGRPDEVIYGQHYPTHAVLNPADRTY